MKAVNDNILVKLLEEIKEVSILKITSNEEETLCRAEIVSVGSKVTEPILKEGEKCLIFKNKLVKIEKDLYMTSESQILVVM